MFPNDSTNELAPQVKRCSKCGEVKPISEFYASKQKKDGLYPHCKTCHRVYTKAYEQSETGKEKSAMRAKEWYDNRGGKDVRRDYGASEKERERRARYEKSDAGKISRARHAKRRRPLNRAKYRANQAVVRAVRKGTLPHISTQQCAGCENPAVEYHHWSYLREHWLDVEPLCKMCHAKTYTTPYE